MATVLRHCDALGRQCVHQELEEKRYRSLPSIVDVLAIEAKKVVTQN